jgi:hypothetical protein
MKTRDLKSIAAITVLFTTLFLTACSTDDGYDNPAPDSGTKPIVTSFTPDFGYGTNINTQVSITGENFSETENLNTIKFGTVQAIVLDATATHLITRVPDGAVTGKISVTVDGAKGVSATNFIVVIPETITSFAPTTGAVGTAITINGTNFSTTPADNIVLFNGHEAIPTSATTTKLVVNVPAGATSGRIAVSLNGIDAVSDIDFVVTP